MSAMSQAAPNLRYRSSGTLWDTGRGRLQIRNFLKSVAVKLHL